MITRELMYEDKEAYNALVTHPLQSWQWGDFREKMGLRVVRVGTFDEHKMISAYQFTLHSVPYTSYTIGYMPKGPLPNEQMIADLKKIGRDYNAIFIQLEPNVVKEGDEKDTKILGYKDIKKEENNSKYPSILISQYPNLKPSARPLFTRYTFLLDLTKTEEELLSQMNQKTRYNVRLAQKHGVVIQRENTRSAFERYLELTKETTRRQKFYAHSELYHRRMWEVMGSSGIAHLFTATYQEKILVTWIVFLFNNVLYYPYGASSQENKEVMASNLMMWEVMKWGKTHGARTFDLWGTAGPNPSPRDPYYGFHRFKEGYGPRIIEFVGSYDLVLQSAIYRLFTTADKLRWSALKVKALLDL